MLSKREVKMLNQMRKKRLGKLKRAFYSKKQNHLNSNKYEKFNELIKAKPSDILFEMRFRSSFSLYLYLYLKSIATFYPESSISEPVEVNFEKLKRLSGLSKNTIKAGFWELIQNQLIFFNEDTPVRMKHNQCKSILVFNDKYLIDACEIENKMNYNSKVKL